LLYLGVALRRMLMGGSGYAWCWALGGVAGEGEGVCCEYDAGGEGD